MKEQFGKCSICRDKYTLQRVAVDEDAIIYVCSECIEKGRDHFIWLCMVCGKSYVRPKDLVIARIKDRELKKAYMLCENDIVIQGIETCISCSPERMLDYAEMHEATMDC